MPRINIDHNVGDLLKDIGKVKGKLRQIPDRVERAMKIVKADARLFIRQDADFSGQLKRAIGVSKERRGRGKYKVSVHTDAEKAPYAPLIEYGSGARSNIPYEGSQPVPPETLSRSLHDPKFEAPDIDMEGPQFWAFAGYIEEWMREKPVEPELGSFQESSVAIAQKIIEKGQYAHPYMRPAWAQNEDNVRRAARKQVRRATR